MPRSHDQRYDNPLHVLLALRDGEANDWVSLCQKFEVPPNSQHTGSYLLRRSLEGLESIGLVEVGQTGEQQNWRDALDAVYKLDKLEPNFPIAVTHRVRELQNALGISLSEISRLDDQAVVAAPLFGQPRRRIFDTEPAPDIFVLMPFRSELRPVYDDHIRSTVESLHLTVARADDFFTTHAIMRDVWNSIWSAKAIIADCTGRNPHVFYELGMAHTVGKPVVIISQSSADVPF
jgi:hypothetical protein